MPAPQFTLVPVDDAALTGPSARSSRPFRLVPVEDEDVSEEPYQASAERPAERQGWAQTFRDIPTQIRASAANMAFGNQLGAHAEVAQAEALGMNPESLAGRRKLRELREAEAANPGADPERSRILSAFDRPTSERIEELRGAIREADADMQSTQQQDQSLMQRGVQGAATSLAVTLPAMATGVLTRNPSLSASTLLPLTEGQSLADFDAKGLTHDRAKLHAGVQGLIEVGTELVPFGKLFGRGTPGRSRLVEFLKTELIGESVATIGQAIDQVIAESPPGATAEEVLTGIQQGIEQLPETWVSTVLAGGAQVGTVSAAGRLANRPRETQDEPRPTDDADRPDLEAQQQETADLFRHGAPALEEPLALPAPRQRADFEVNSAGYAAPVGQSQRLLSQGEEGTTGTMRVSSEGVARPETHLERSDTEQAEQRWRDLGMDEVAGANQGRGQLSRMSTQPGSTADVDLFTDHAEQQHEIHRLTEDEIQGERVGDAGSMRARPGAVLTEQPDTRSPRDRSDSMQTASTAAPTSSAAMASGAATVSSAPPIPSGERPSGERQQAGAWWNGLTEEQRSNVLARQGLKAPAKSPWSLLKRDVQLELARSLENVNRGADGAAQSASAEVVHQDRSGDRQQTATATVINQSAVTARGKGIDLKAARAKLLEQIDATHPADDMDALLAYRELKATEGKGKVAAHRLADRDKELANLRERIGFEVFDVPGDGRFKVLKTPENLAKFRKQVVNSQGFKVGTKPTPARGTSGLPTIRKAEPAAAQKLYGHHSDDSLRELEQKQKGELTKLLKEAANSPRRGNDDIDPRIANVTHAIEAIQRDMIRRGLRTETDMDAVGAPVERSEDGASSVPLAPERKKPKASANTIFTEDAAAAARERLRKKLGQINSGIDPEMIQDGITLAGYHIEAGARTFAAYSKAMIADMGDAVRPYLKSWYMANRFDPRSFRFLKDMDDAATVEAANVDAPLAASASPANTAATTGVTEGAGRQSAIDVAANEAATSPTNGRALPSAAQREAENYKAGAPIKLYGRTIRVENPKDSFRTNFDEKEVAAMLKQQIGKKARASLSSAIEAYRNGDAEQAVKHLKAAAETAVGGTNGTEPIKKLAQRTWANEMPAHYGRILGTKAPDGDHIDIFLGPQAADESLPVFVIDTNKRGTSELDEFKVLAGYPSQEAAIAAFESAYPAGFGASITRAVREMTPEDFRSWLDNPKPSNTDQSKVRKNTERPRSDDTAPPRRNPPADNSSKSAADPSWSSPEATRLDDVLYTLQDKHIDMKRVQQAIKKATSVDQLADDVDAYLKEELFHGRVATRLQRFLNDELNPFLKQLNVSGISLEELEQYLWARFAPERNAVIAKINPTMPDGGSGMTNQAAADYLDSLPADRRKRLEQLAKSVDAMTNQTRETLVGYGLESQTTVDGWREQSPHYVPLHREGMEEDFNGKPRQGFSVRGPSTKAALGSRKNVANIIANIAMQRERAISDGEKNRVANALLGLVRTNPNPQFWTVDEPRRVRHLNRKAERVVESDDPRHKDRQNVITARTVDLNGDVVEHTIEFQDDPRALRMARSLKSLDVDDLGRFLTISGKTTRYFASISTQYNPFFGVVNIYRDVKATLLNLTSTPLNGKQAKILGDTFSAMRGIWVDTRAARKGKHPASSWAKLWEEFQDVGGQTGYRDMFRTSNDRAEAIQSELRQMSAGKGLLAFHALRDLVSDFNLTMENAVRLATYKAGKDARLSNERAASIAKNISVNFNRKGALSNKIGAMYMFFNANAQGNARMIETLAGPKGKQIIAGGLFLGVLQALLLDAFDYDEDDPPEFVRERNLVIPLPGTDKRYLLSPYPLGYHVLPSIGRVAAELWNSGGEKAPEKVTELLSIMVDAFNPLGGAGLSMQTILPTSVGPIPADVVAALIENKGWTGEPIARKDFSDQNPTPGHTRAKASASDFSRATSRIINGLTGGTEYVASKLFSPTPDQIDYLIGQATGGVGREAKKTWDTAGSLLSAELPPAYKVPLLGRFYGSANDEANYGNKFYDLVRRSNDHKQELEGRASDGGDVYGYLDENPEARIFEGVLKASGEVSKMRRWRRDAEKEGASKEQLKQIDAAITAKMREAVEAAKAIREQ